MSIVLLKFLDIFFIIFHTAVTLFNLFGYLFKKTRFANLICLLITAFSWFILGLWHGIGYCFLVDWHWQVRQKLGHFDDPHSYVKFLLDKITGMDFDATFVNIMTTVLFFLALAASVLLNVRDYRKKHSRDAPL